MHRVRIVLAAAAVFVVGAAIVLRSAHGGVHAAGWPVWLAAVVGFALTEVMTSHIQVRRETYTFSISEVPFVIGLVALSPVALVAARLLGTGAASAWRRVPPHKAAYNLAVFALETSIAAWVVRSGGGSSEEARFWFVVIAAVALANLLNAAALAFAISLFQPGAFRRMLGVTARSQLLYLMNSCLATLVAVSIRISWSLAIAGLVPVIGLLVAARLYESMQRRYEHLDALLGFTTALSGSDDDAVLPTALHEIRRLLNVEFVEIFLVPTEHSGALRLSLADDDATELTALVPDPTVVERLAALTAPTVLDDPAAAIAMLGDSARPIHELLAIPVGLADQRLGAVVAVNRLGSSRAFVADDLMVGAAIVNHLAVVLQSNTLVGQLDELAQRDPLTGLLNAHGLEVQLATLTMTPGHGAIVVELLDFKEIGDALGRSVGDELLTGVAERVGEEVGGDAVVARIGAAEIVVVLDTSGGAGIIARAERVLDALRRPFTHAGLRLGVTPIVGIALAELGVDAGADDLSALVHRAAAATSDARRDGQSSAVATTGHSDDVRRRLVLAAALPDALEQHGLVVHFQPKIEIATGRVAGAEALVRWTHGDLGPIPPPDIVEIAERGGLIRPLTDYVIRAALREVAVARTRGHDLDVAVNLSPRDLLDPQLPRTVMALLDESGLPVDALQLEVTEGSVMTDPRRAIELLTELRDLGIRLAVDDYGTGYSSLSYLRRLPIHQVKIDKSFVLGLGGRAASARHGGPGDRSPRIGPDDDGSTGDEVIVRSTIDLGHNLGLQVVAEGVETTESLDLLAELQCDYAQGYLFSAPLPAAAFHGWIEQFSGRRRAA